MSNVTAQKHQLVLAPKFVDPDVEGNVAVVDTASGVVTAWDKVKAYYKGAIAIVGATLVVLNQVTPIFNFVPDPIHHYFTVIVAVVTAAGVVLKQNEHWFGVTE